MNHRTKFKNFLNKKDLTYETIDIESGDFAFTFYKSIENGPRLLLAVIFNPDDTIVDLAIYKIPESVMKNLMNLV